MNALAPRSDRECPSEEAFSPRVCSLTPAWAASNLSASPKSRFSRRMMKAKMSPPVPHAPKQCQFWLSGNTMKEGVFSL